MTRISVQSERCCRQRDRHRIDDEWLPDPLSEWRLPAPLLSSTNFRPGQTRANNAVIALGPDGNLSVFCGIPSGTVQLVLDVTGYSE